MSDSPELHDVAQAVLSRAKHQGFILPSEIRSELKEAGQPATLWKHVVRLIRDSLKYRHGRYYARPVPQTPLQREQTQRQQVRRTLEEFLRLHQEGLVSEDRRREDRLPFVRHIKVRTEDGTEISVLAQDVSPFGIQLITSRSLLGRKLLVHLATASQSAPVIVAIRVVWSCAIADGLFKNGGSFLELIA